MSKIAVQFEKVSFDQFRKDFIKSGMGKDYIRPDEDFEKWIKKIYEDIPIPKRATGGSAGYDFVLPFSISMDPNTSLVIPTGIRTYFDKDSSDYGLFIFPKSGLGFNYNLALSNTVGVVDSDYYGSSNEGHIMIKLSYQPTNTLCVSESSQNPWNPANNGYDNPVATVPEMYFQQDRIFSLERGKKFAQGIFLPFAVSIFDEDVLAVRDGGFGSTENK